MAVHLWRSAVESSGYRTRTLYLLLTACLCFAGCFKSAPELETWPVQGTVVDQNGTAPTGGVVRLLTEADSQLIAVGPIQPDGSFTVHTQRQGFDYDGAVAGEYQVLVITAKEGPDGTPSPVRYLIPQSYVVRREPNNFELMIQR